MAKIINAKRKRPTDIAIVGSGSVARALAVGLTKSGYSVAEVVVRDRPESLGRARKIARKVGAQPKTWESASLDASILWLCLTDSAIASTANALAAKKTSWRGQMVFHASGALTSEELVAFKRKGASIASVHPMNTFNATAGDDLGGTPFGLEGDTAAVRAAAPIVRKLNGGAEVLRIRREHKVLYHAMGSFSSPLMVALLRAGEDVARAAGIRDANAIRGPLLLKTLKNYFQNGADAAFGGPIKRGDKITVNKHLAALRKHKDLEQIYRALAGYAKKTLVSKR